MVPRDYSRYVTDAPLLKADLHVHSWHSGYNRDLPFFRSRDCYSLPEEVYRRAKRRGMDLVTITDHDSIDGCLEFLDRHPDADDFLIGEEIECRFPGSDLKVHIGAIGIDERIHREVQPLRGSVYEVAALLRAEGVPFTANHLFHFFRDQIDLTRYVAELSALFPAFETLNGTMLRRHNDLVSRIVTDCARQGRCLSRVGGSDGHILRRIGRTYTEVPARDRTEFLANLAAGLGRARGRDGSTATLAVEIYGVVLNYFASLIGLRKDALDWGQRLTAIGFSVLSIPFQIAPLAVAVVSKGLELQRLARWEREWTGANQEVAPVTAGLAAAVVAAEE